MVPSPRSMRMASPIWSMMFGWMPSVGSSRMSSLGLVSSDAGDGELLLLAAGEHAALAFQEFLDDGEQGEDPVDWSAVRLDALGAGADEEVFLDGEVREDLAALGHIAEARCGRVRRWSMRSIRLPMNSMAPDSSGQQAHERLEGRAFAHTVAAHQAEDRFGRMARFTPRRMALPPMERREVGEMASRLSVGHG